MEKVDSIEEISECLNCGKPKCNNCHQYKSQIEYRKRYEAKRKEKREGKA